MIGSTHLGRVIAAALGLVLWGCSNVQSPQSTQRRMIVNSEHDRRFDFSPLRTYIWHPDRLDTGDPRVDDRLLERRIREAVEEQLSAKGYERKLAGPSDFIVAYHATLTGKLDTRHYGYSHGQAWGAGRSASVREYDAGTLVIDVVGPDGERLLWRGWAQTEVRLEVDSEKRKIERIRRAARQILARFPPGPTTR